MIYLKFDNRLQFEMVMNDYFTQDTETDEDGNVTPVGDKYLIGKWRSQDHGCKAGQWELWVRDELFQPTGETTTDAEGNEIPIKERIPGFHVDLNPKLGSHPIEEWTEDGFIIEPENPQFR